MTEDQDTQLRVPTFLEMCDEWHKAVMKMETINRLQNLIPSGPGLCFDRKVGKQLEDW